MDRYECCSDCARSGKECRATMKYLRSLNLAVCDEPHCGHARSVHPSEIVPPAVTALASATPSALDSKTTPAAPSASASVAPSVINPAASAVLWVEVSMFDLAERAIVMLSVVYDQAIKALANKYNAGRPVKLYSFVYPAHLWSRVSIDSQPAYSAYLNAPKRSTLYVHPAVIVASSATSGAAAPTVIASATATATAPAASASPTAGAANLIDNPSPPRTRFPALRIITALPDEPDHVLSPNHAYKSQSQMAAVVKKRDDNRCVMEYENRQSNVHQPAEAVHVLSASETYRTLRAGAPLTAAGAKHFPAYQIEPLATPIPVSPTAPDPKTDSKSDGKSDVFTHRLVSEVKLSLPVNGGPYDPRLAIYCDQRLKRAFESGHAFVRNGVLQLSNELRASTDERYTVEPQLSRFHGATLRQPKGTDVEAARDWPPAIVFDVHADLAPTFRQLFRMSGIPSSPHPTTPTTSEASPGRKAASACACAGCTRVGSGDCLRTGVLPRFNAVCEQCCLPLRVHE